MDKKKISKRLEEVRKEISKLDAPKDPNQKKREKLVGQLYELQRMEQKNFQKAVKETKKLLAKEIKELKGLCKRDFSGVLPVKAKIKVKLEVIPTDLDPFESSCAVSIDFPKNKRGLNYFLSAWDNTAEVFPDAGINDTKHARGLLPDLDKHLDKLESIQKAIVNKIKKEAAKHGLQRELDEFVREVID